MSAVEPEKASQERLPAEGATTEEARLFAAEMARLGLIPPEGRQEKGEAAGGPGPAGGSVEERERQEFLAALEDEVERPEGDSPEEDSDRSGRARSRRLRQVARGRLHPEAELDLHGRTRAEAEFRLRNFLDTAVYQDYRTLLVITGKGHHSTDRPVLREAVEEILATCRPPVVEWGAAPRRLGGQGALIVFLKERA